MPSVIKFSGNRDDSLLVTESVDEVAAMFTAAGDAPLRLTRNIGTPVFINRGRIAYWHDYTRGRQGLDSRRAVAPPV
jgi:hypothetical protein